MDMEWNIVTLFPIEIWEHIVSFCDGETMLTLLQMNDTFRTIIKSLDERRSIWDARCLDEIPDEDRIDIRHKLYPDKLVPPSWSQIYRVWYKWQNLSTSSFEVLKTRKSYLDIAEIKVSNDIIIVADKTGFALVNLVSGALKKFKIGPVKHLELLIRRSIRRPQGTNFLHDVLDCTIGNFHMFFDLHRMNHLRCDKHENQVLRYCFGEKESNFLPPVLEANIFDDLLLYVTETYIRQVVRPMNIVSQIDYSWTGARCWFLWHAKLLFCVKDGTLDIYLNGRLRSFAFEGYPRISAVFYFGSILFLGSIHGSLYIYRIEADNIFSFNFDDYESKVDVCSTAIVGIDIVENDTINSCIVVATDRHVYCVIPETFSTALCREGKIDKRQFYNWWS